MNNADIQFDIWCEVVDGFLRHSAAPHVPTEELRRAWKMGWDAAAYAEMICHEAENPVDALDA